MKSGTYSMLLSCDGFSGKGTLELDGVSARGGDTCYRVDGQITQAGKTLIGALTIDLAPGASGNRRINGPFACAMTGSGGDDNFALYGVGPLGLIIEIKAQWAGAIENRTGDRRQSA